MEQYIPKSVVLTEIDRLHKAHSGKYGCDEVGLNLEYLENFIDTIEVKEVNSNKVLIEKACKWLKENITNNPNADSVLVRNGCVTLGMLIEDFKNYMKGE